MPTPIKTDTPARVLRAHTRKSEQNSKHPHAQENAPQLDKAKTRAFLHRPAQPAKQARKRPTPQNSQQPRKRAPKTPTRKPGDINTFPRTSTTANQTIPCQPNAPAPIARKHAKTPASQQSHLISHTRASQLLPMKTRPIKTPTRQSHQRAPNVPAR